MKIGTKVGLLVAGLVAAQVVTVAGTGYLLVSENASFGALVAQQSEDLDTIGNLTLERGEQNRAFAELGLYGAPRPDETPQQSQARYEQFLTEYRYREDKLAQRTRQARTLSDPALIAAVGDFDAVQAQVTQVQESRLGAIRTGGYDPRVDVETIDLNRESEQILGQAIGVAHQSAQEGVAAQAAASRRLIAIGGALSLLLVLISAAFATIVSRRIVGPIRRLTEGAQRVASTELPQTVAEIRRASGQIETPALTTLSSDTEGDELQTLSKALNDLQHSAVDLAVQTRRSELAANETLVNLGRRNLSLLNRTLSYVGELESNERDPKVLANLFRLDHLTTRIRRNAESMLVLAGAEQGRVHTRPVAMAQVVRAALSEIEDYARVHVGTVGTTAVHGPHAADLAHLLAELLENATRFSGDDSLVALEGAATAEGYQIIVRDEGLGMNEEDLAEANRTIVEAEESQVSTTVLGLHVVGRLAARRGIRVHLQRGETRGLVAVVDLPSSILVAATTDQDTTPVRAEQAQEQPVQEQAAESRQADETEQAREAEAVEAVIADTQPDQDQPAETQPAQAPLADADAGAEDGADDAQVAPAEPVLTEPDPAVSPETEPAETEPAEVEPVPAAETEPAETEPAPVVRAAPAPVITADYLRAQSAAVRAEPVQPAVPAPAEPAVPAATEPVQPAVPAPAEPVVPAQRQAPVARTSTRRVRGAQMPDLGDSSAPLVASRDADRVGRQLSGLQSSVARARRESGERASDQN